MNPRILTRCPCGEIEERDLDRRAAVLAWLAHCGWHVPTT